MSSSLSATQSTHRHQEKRHKEPQHKRRRQHNAAGAIGDVEYSDTYEQQYQHRDDVHTGYADEGLQTTSASPKRQPTKDYHDDDDDDQHDQNIESKYKDRELASIPEPNKATNPHRDGHRRKHRHSDSRRSSRSYRDDASESSGSSDSSASSDAMSSSSIITPPPSPPSTGRRFDSRYYTQPHRREKRQHAASSSLSSSSSSEESSLGGFFSRGPPTDRKSSTKDDKRNRNTAASSGRHVTFDLRGKRKSKTRDDASASSSTSSTVSSNGNKATSRRGRANHRRDYTSAPISTKSTNGVRHTSQSGRATKKTRKSGRKSYHSSLSVSDSSSESHRRRRNNQHPSSSSSSSDGDDDGATQRMFDNIKSYLFSPSDDAKPKASKTRAGTEASASSGAVKYKPGERTSSRRSSGVVLRKSLPSKRGGDGGTHEKYGDVYDQDQRTTHKRGASRHRGDTTASADEDSMTDASDGERNDGERNDSGRRKKTRHLPIDDESDGVSMRRDQQRHKHGRGSGSRRKNESSAPMAYESSQQPQDVKEYDPFAASQHASFNNQYGEVVNHTDRTYVAAPIGQGRHTSSNGIGSDGRNTTAANHASLQDYPPGLSIGGVGTPTLYGNVDDDQGHHGHTNGNSGPGDRRRRRTKLERRATLGGSRDVERRANAAYASTAGGLDGPDIDVATDDSPMSDYIDPTLMYTSVNGGGGGDYVGHPHQIPNSMAQSHSTSFLRNVAINDGGLHALAPQSAFITR